MTFIALGILEKDGKVLVCRRNRSFFHDNLWEFPTTVVEHGETVEDSLEKWVFEATGVLSACEKAFPALNGPGCRIFPVKMNTLNEKKSLSYYDFCKLLKYKDLRWVNMTFPSVIFIKNEKKLGIFHLG